MPRVPLLDEVSARREEALGRADCPPALEVAEVWVNVGIWRDKAVRTVATGQVARNDDIPLEMNADEPANSPVQAGDTIGPSGPGTCGLCDAGGRQHRFECPDQNDAATLN